MMQAALAIYSPVAAVGSTVFRGFVSDGSYVMHPTENYIGVAVLLVDAPTYAKRDGTWTPVAELLGYRRGDSLASDFLD